MDISTILNTTLSIAVPIGMGLAAELGRRFWLEFKQSNKFKEMGFIQRKIAEIVVDSVAATYSSRVRGMKAQNKAEGIEGLKPSQKVDAENSAINTIKMAAQQAGITASLPSESILRGKVVEAVNSAKAKRGNKLSAIKSSTTKGGI